MEDAIRLLNEMVTRGLLDSYAIGGAMASLFYAEPVLLGGTAPDRRLLDEILERHGLRDRWNQWTTGHV